MEFVVTESALESDLADSDFTLPLSREFSETIEDWDAPAEFQDSIPSPQPRPFQQPASSLIDPAMLLSDWSCTKCKDSVSLTAAHICRQSNPQRPPESWKCAFCRQGGFPLDQEKCGKCFETNYVIQDRKKLLQMHVDLDRIAEDLIQDAPEMETLLSEIEKLEETVPSSSLNDEDEFIPTLDISVQLLRAIADQQASSKANYIPDSIKEIFQRLDWRCVSCNATHPHTEKLCRQCSRPKPKPKSFFS